MPESIRKQFEELARIAREHGRAIGIGHPHPATISELRQWLADPTSKQGIKIVPVQRYPVAVDSSSSESESRSSP